MTATYFLYLCLFNLFFLNLNAFRYAEKNQTIRVTVAEISPYSNPSETYRYYMLPYCQPEKIIEEWQSLGEDLSGDRTMNSLYTFQFLGNCAYIYINNKDVFIIKMKGGCIIYRTLRKKNMC